MVFELGILALLRFDHSDSACTGSILGSNTTLDTACTSSISGSKYFGVQYSRYCLYFKHFGGQYSRYRLYSKVFRGWIIWILFVLQVFWGSMLSNTAVLGSILGFNTLEYPVCTWSIWGSCTAHTFEYSQYFGIQYCQYFQYSEYFRISYCEVQ